MRGSRIQSGCVRGARDPVEVWRGCRYKGLLRVVGNQLGSKWWARRGGVALAACSVCVHTCRAVVAHALGAAGELQLRFCGTVEDCALVDVAKVCSQAGLLMDAAEAARYGAFGRGGCLYKR